MQLIWGVCAASQFKRYKLTGKWHKSTVHTAIFKPAWKYRERNHETGLIDHKSLYIPHFS